ncbi:MAG: hypothetical protein ABSA59_02320 [Terriglobia bacterium]|jgi:large-conductance mechanosensitive channel
MLQKLRQILLTQYIGAIVTAIVAAQCVQTFVSLMISILWHMAIVWRTPASLLGESPDKGFDWAITIYSLINGLLNAAVVYGLIRWLYFGHQPIVLPDGAAPEPPAPETPSLNS